jgi:aromatic ring-cleaving dioxygenase
MRDPTSEISEFHAHVYFTPETRPHAARLRERLLENESLKIYTMSDGPRGPHLVTMFGVDIPKAELPEVLGFLMLNHGDLPVLIHPVTANEVEDHTIHALWLGPPQPLDLGKLS